MMAAALRAPIVEDLGVSYVPGQPVNFEIAAPRQPNSRKPKENSGLKPIKAEDSTSSSSKSGFKQNDTYSTAKRSETSKIPTEGSGIESDFLSSNGSGFNPRTLKKSDKYSQENSPVPIKSSAFEDVVLQETFTAPESKPEKKVTSRIVKLVIFLVLAGLIVFAIVNSDLVIGWVVGFLNWVQGAGALGPIAFAGVYMVSTVAVVPGLILTLGAGLVFTNAFGAVAGIIIGSIAVFIGASAGATIAFVLARTLLRDTIKRLSQKSVKFQAIDRVLGQRGFSFTFLLRLSPLIPFNVFNYFMGISSVTFRDYVFAHFGLLPGTIAFVAIGSTIGSIADAANGNFDGGITFLILLIVGTGAALAVSLYLSLLAKREINRAVSQQNFVENGDEAV